MASSFSLESLIADCSRHCIWVWSPPLFALRIVISFSSFETVSLKARAVLDIVCAKIWEFAARPGSYFSSVLI